MSADEALDRVNGLPPVKLEIVQIRPLVKIESGHWRSADGWWEFMCEPEHPHWWFSYLNDNPEAFFFGGQPTLKEATEDAARVKPEERS